MAYPPTPFESLAWPPSASYYPQSISQLIPDRKNYLPLHPLQNFCRSLSYGKSPQGF